MNAVARAVMKAQAREESTRGDLEMLRPRFEALSGSVECNAIRASWRPPRRARREPKRRPSDSNYKWTRRGIHELQEIYLLCVQVLRGKAVIVGDEDQEKRQESKMEREQEHEDGLARMARESKVDASKMNLGLRPFGVPDEEPEPEPIKTSQERIAEAIERRERERSVDAPWRSLKAHPFADLLPMMSEETKAALSVSIRKHGCIEPGVLLDGMILDGRNRHAVCKALDVPFPTRQFDPRRDGEPFDFVLRHNVERRQMTKCQLCVVALGLVTTKQGRPEKGLPSRPLFSIAEAAERFGVSRQYMLKVHGVLRLCDEDERRAMLQGKVTLGQIVAAKRGKAPVEDPLAKDEGPSVEAANHERGPSSVPEPRPVVTPPVPHRVEAPQARSSVDMQRLRARLSELDHLETQETEETARVEQHVEREPAVHARTEVPEHVEREQEAAPDEATFTAVAVNVRRRVVIDVPPSDAGERFIAELRQMVNAYQLSMTVELG